MTNVSDPNTYGDLEKQLSEGSSDAVCTVTVTGTDSEYIILDNKKYRKSDFINAFGSDLAPHAKPYEFGNPLPLGLCAFALTIFVLSLINCQAKSVETPNIIVGLAFFYGGLVLVLTGMWEIAVNSTFGGTALGSYGGFWLSFGAIYVKWFGIADAYDDPIEFKNAVGFYLLGWAIFTFILVVCTLKSSLAFFSMFFFLDLTFILLAAGYMADKVNVIKAGGVIGCLTAFIAWYNAFAGLATNQNSYVLARDINFPQNIFKKNI